MVEDMSEITEFLTKVMELNTMISYFKDLYTITWDIYEVPLQVWPL